MTYQDDRQAVAVVLGTVVVAAAPAAAAAAGPAAGLRGNQGLGRCPKKEENMRERNNFLAYTYIDVSCSGFMISPFLKRSNYSK